MPLIPNLWWTPLQSSGSISHQSWFSSKHHDGRGGIWNLVQTPQKNLKTRGEAEWVFKFVCGVWPPLSVVFSLYNTSTQISASIFQNLSQIPLRNHSVWKIRGVWLKHSLKIWKLTQNFENSLKFLVSSRCGGVGFGIWLSNTSFPQRDVCYKTKHFFLL